MRPVFLLLGVCACGVPEAPETEIAVTDDPSALSSRAEDPLFELKLEQSAHTYAPAGIEVTAEGILLGCEHVDADDDWRLSAGDTLRCWEPRSDVFDERMIGSPLLIDLSERRDGQLHLLARGSWTPAN